MIQSFSIENFKSFRKATLPLSPLTLLIGANASGKSNAIEAIQVLSWLGSGKILQDLFYDVREDEITLRGGPQDLPREGGVIRLGCDFGTPGSAASFSIALALTEKGFRVAEAQVVQGQKVLHRHDAKESEGPGNYLPFIRDLCSVLFLEPNPRRMREYNFPQETGLKRDGSALSSVLHRLTEDKGEKSTVLSFIRSLPEQDVLDISYLYTPRGEVMMRIHETFGGVTVPREAALLSDGTLRVLAVAAALLSIPEGSVLIVEEIDNGVHPSRAKKLLADIQRIARERDLRILLTTHNPALLDALPLEAVPDTVACYRDPQEGDSHLIRLQELESYPELVAQGPLGYLVTQGIMDRFLKDPSKRDRETKVEQGLAWLSEFRRAQSS